MMATLHTMMRKRMHTGKYLATFLSGCQGASPPPHPLAYLSGPLAARVLHDPSASPLAPGSHQVAVMAMVR